MGFNAKKLNFTSLKMPLEMKVNGKLRNYARITLR